MHLHPYTIAPLMHSQAMVQHTFHHTRLTLGTLACYQTHRVGCNTFYGIASLGQYNDSIAHCRIDIAMLRYRHIHRTGT